MLISRNWLNDYIDTPEDDTNLAEILTNLGLEVEGIDRVESIKGGLKGLVVGEVIECEPHPNADRLKLTKVDIGQDELLGIVCGAPNVNTGLKVVVATVGTWIHLSNDESFQIKKSKIRGEVSQGMLCSETEIGLGDDSSGIMILPADFENGKPIKNYFEIINDTIFDIGLTPNRSDATSHLGVAKDLSSYYHFHLNKKEQITTPQSFEAIDGNPSLKSFDVIIDNVAQCPRFTGVCLSNIEIKSSPDWIKNRLKAIGIRPINNVVDITNYVLHEYGQPLHAYDISKIQGERIIVKSLKEGTKFTTLDLVERSLSAADIMVCDGLENPMCIGGVFGGSKSGVSENTDSIFLEAAFFNAKMIRNTSTKHNLRTDAAKCFEKGVDPNNTLNALKRAIYLMQKYANAMVNSEIVDVYPTSIESKKITVSVNQINNLIGNSLSNTEIENLFKALSFDYVTTSDNTYDLKIPTNKADVTRPADVIEELLRIYGYNNVTIDQKFTMSVQASQYPASHQIKNSISQFLIGKGFSEMMGLSIMESRKIVDYPWIDNNQLVQIANTSNISLNTMRPDMMLSGLESIRYNINRQQNNVMLYEFGRTYLKEEQGYKEKEHLTLFLVGNQQEDSWLSPTTKIDFYFLKKIVVEIIQKFGLQNHTIRELVNERGLSYGLSINDQKVEIATFGLISSEVLQSEDIKNEVYYAEFDWAYFHNKTKNQKVTVSKISKFPNVRRDLAIVIDQDLSFKSVENVIKNLNIPRLKSLNLFDIYKSESLGQNKKSFAISFTFEDQSQTLKDKEVDKMMKKIIFALQNQVDCTLR